MEKYKGFSVIDNSGTIPHMAQAEFSLLVDNEFEEFIPQKYHPYSRYFFNRLIVPKPLRRKGIATNLLRQTEEWADSNMIVLVNLVNVYSDSDLTEEQTINLYKTHRFVQLTNAPSLLLIRFPI